MKKKCVTVGICQAAGVHKFLKDFSNFEDEYEYQIFANWQLIKDANQVTEHGLASERMLEFNRYIKEADLVIYQPCRDFYNCFSTHKSNPNSFLNLLKPGCKTFSFPRIHNNAFFPICHKRDNQQPMYGYIKNNVNTVDELFKLYDDNELDFDFETRLKQNYECGKEKEKDCDIKIVDFIYDNIKKHKLFLMQDHPTSMVINEITRQLCEILGLTYNLESALKVDEAYWGGVDPVYNRQSHQLPISKYAINHFKFEYVHKQGDDADEFYKSILLHFLLKEKGVDIKYIKTHSKGCTVYM